MNDVLIVKFEEYLHGLDYTDKAHTLKINW